MRVLTLFTILTKTEQRRFGKYLEAFESDQRVISLFEYLKKYQDKPKWLSEERMFFGIYKTEISDKEDNKRKFTILRNKLTTRIKNLIIHDRLTLKEYADFRLNKELILLEYIGNKLNLTDSNDKLHDEYVLMLGQVKRTASSQKRDIFYYANLWRLYHLDYFNLHTNREKSDKKFNLLIKNFQKFYYLAILQYAAEKHAREHIIGEQLEFYLPPDIHIKSTEFASENEVLFGIYGLYYDLVTSFDIEKFTVLKNIVKSQYKQIKKAEIANILVLLNNLISIKAVSEGNNININQELYDIYSFGFEHKIFEVIGQLNARLVMNYVFLSVELKAFDELEANLNTYVKKVEKSKRLDTKDVCQAYLYFSKEKFREAFATLNQRKPTNMNVYLTRRSLRIKSLYHVEVIGGIPYDDDTFLINECGLFRSNLEDRKHRGELGEDICKNNQNFVNFVLLLQKEHFAIKKQHSKKILLDKLDEQSIAYRNWLRKMVEELYK